MKSNYELRQAILDKWERDMLIEKIVNVHVDDIVSINKYIEYIEDRPFNDKRYYISNDKLKKLGWSITVDFETGINDLIK